MLEKKYEYSLTDEKLVERIVDDENIHLNHMVLIQGTNLAEHYSNSNVYMIIVKGTMSLQLGQQEVHKYSQGEIIYIPYRTRMNVRNDEKQTLDFFVVKSPNPKNYRSEK